MNTPELAKSKNLKIALSIVGILLVMFISFAGGVAVGLRKAKFSYQWGHNYERNFMGFGHGNVGMREAFDRDQMMGGRFTGAMMDFPRSVEGRDFRNAYGVSGTVISIADNKLIVKDREGKENTVAVTDKTIIKDHAVDVKLTDIKNDDQIVVMGKPDEQGLITADLIRVSCCSGSGEAESDVNDSNK